MKINNLLFICSRNRWRSPTGEEVWRKKGGYNVRSAGTSPRAKKTVSVADVQWADIIFVMEKKHKTKIVADYNRLLKYKPIYILDIPDEYKFMDAELISELDVKVSYILENAESNT